MKCWKSRALGSALKRTWFAKQCQALPSFRTPCVLRGHSHHAERMIVSTSYRTLLPARRAACRALCRVQIMQQSTGASTTLKICDGEDADRMTKDVESLVNRGWALDDQQIELRKTYHFKTYTKVLVGALLHRDGTAYMSRTSITASGSKAKLRTIILP